MSEPWFRPKTIGYGAGLPIHWKGWALLGVYVAALFAIPPALDALAGTTTGPWLRLGVIAIVTVPFVLIVKARTKGGWRWRGRHDEPERDEAGTGAGEEK